ncbi:spore coat protein H [Entomortierella parvispora]|uniref:Spore coat protein H n=1 Tax=Entomortierella parvispora TaxID=205924 RepID=A0A9P3HEB2_9FUNG|nr:spore coat protein H [Entomortierella parvispora]
MVRLLILAACAAVALADVNFNVIGFRGADVEEYGVIINGKVTNLKTTKETYPLWSAKVAGVNAPLEYQYVRLNNKGVAGKEAKARKLPSGAVKTPNEYFDRPNTIHTLPPLPQVYENKWTRNSPLFREGYIGNLLIEGDPKQWKYLHSGGKKWWNPKPVKVKIHYIGATEDVKIEGVQLQLSGGQTRSYSKLPYKFTFPKGHELLDVEMLKLRSAETDATMIRENLYIDVLNTLGVPAPQASYVRVFFNMEPVGLYVAEEIMKEHWVKAALHTQSPSSLKPGSLWKMGADDGFRADLQWKGNKVTDYQFGNIYKQLLLGDNPKKEPMRDLIQLMLDAKNYDPKTEKDPVGYWEKRLDLEIFLRSMAMEYLGGFWDGYWRSGSNYQMYHDPTTKLWTWLPVDYDDTFGSSYPRDELGPYRNLPVKSQSALVQKLILQTPQINARFEAILKETVSYVFKPQALLPRVAAYKDMIIADVEWDRNLPRLNTNGDNEKFTVQDVAFGVAEGKKDKIGLKGWITMACQQVEKQFKFKALAGTPNKVPPRVMAQLQSPYGIPEKSAAKVEAKPALTPSNGGTTVATDDAAAAKGSSDTSVQAEKSANSAMVLKSEWSMIVATIALIVLAL